MDGPVILIYELDSYLDFGWVHENHDTFADALKHKQRIEALIDATRTLADHGYDYQWEELALPIHPWDDITPKNVLNITIWARVGHHL